MNRVEKDLLRKMVGLEDHAHLDDPGQTQMCVTYSVAANVVALRFSKPNNGLILTPEGAVQLGEALIENARLLKEAASGTVDRSD